MTLAGDPAVAAGERCIADANYPEPRHILKIAAAFAAP
jgi:hypothetical protein